MRTDVTLLWKVKVEGFLEATGTMAVIEGWCLRHLTFIEELPTTHPRAHRWVPLLNYVLLRHKMKRLREGIGMSGGMLMEGGDADTSKTECLWLNGIIEAFIGSDIHINIYTYIQGSRFLLHKWEACERALVREEGCLQEGGDGGTL